MPGIDLNELEERVTSCIRARAIRSAGLGLTVGSLLGILLRWFGIAVPRADVPFLLIHVTDILFAIGIAVTMWGVVTLRRAETPVRRETIKGEGIRE